ncbi:MAG: hypothetical protein ACREQ5_07670 [Candidatus Dormibacteria bacterium]
MRTPLLALFVLMVAPGVTAAPEQTPTPAICKADLKAWSKSKVESLTIGEIKARMNEMVACADEAHHHHHSDKRVQMYLDEFYRTDAELADRAFDFIVNHNLRDQFYAEEGAARNETASNKPDAKP